MTDSSWVPSWLRGGSADHHKAKQSALSYYLERAMNSEYKFHKPSEHPYGKENASMTKCSNIAVVSAGSIGMGTAVFCALLLRRAKVPKHYSVFLTVAGSSACACTAGLLHINSCTAKCLQDRDSRLAQEARARLHFFAPDHTLLEGFDSEFPSYPALQKEQQLQTTTDATTTNTSS
mmetsp:Transcript_37022/g.72702  ORF Transcript_37022/g.72702 Transcript_37022/m.72702 type:complete len:177 (+) Transcript_37022:53-583(+)